MCARILQSKGHNLAGPTPEELELERGGPVRGSRRGRFSAKRGAVQRQLHVARVVGLIDALQGHRNEIHDRNGK